MDMKNQSYTARLVILYGVRAIARKVNMLKKHKFLTTRELSNESLTANHENGPGLIA